MESVGVGRLQLQAGDGQWLETLSSVLRVIDQFEHRHFHRHRGSPCLAREMAVWHGEWRRRETLATAGGEAAAGSSLRTADQAETVRPLNLFVRPEAGVLHTWSHFVFKN